MDSNRVNLRIGSKKLTRIKNEQNPAILIGFYLFLGLCYGFEPLKLRNVAKTRILGLKSRF